MIDSRARFGMCRSCTLSVAHKIAAELTSLAGDTRNPAAVDLHTAAIAFAQRRYSATRHGAFLAALDAYGSTVGSLLTGER